MNVCDKAVFLAPSLKVTRLHLINQLYLN